MHSIEDRDIDLKKIIRIEARSLYNFGLVAKIIVGEIVHRIKVVYLRYTVHRRNKLLETLVRVFHVSMQHWITNRWRIRHLSLRWTVSFVIKLFLF